ncbi:unnamed protein product [Protopolystoma xenopodis]|uniref:Uncharacterized protein n=1 Tax=Protopolystoma xenopodis TaxID=117903 RepID=A0A448WHW8_9PLAT|nr:unnamed protein product [Protopolystoma xenopodis]
MVGRKLGVFMRPAEARSNLHDKRAWSEQSLAGPASGLVRAAAETSPAAKSVAKRDEQDGDPKTVEFRLPLLDPIPIPIPTPTPTPTSTGSVFPTATVVHNGARPNVSDHPNPAVGHRKPFSYNDRPLGPSSSPDMTPQPQIAKATLSASSQSSPSSSICELTEALPNGLTVLLPDSPADVNSVKPVSRLGTDSARSGVLCVQPTVTFAVPESQVFTDSKKTGFPAASAPPKGRHIRRIEYPASMQERAQALKTRQPKKPLTSTATPPKTDGSGGRSGATIIWNTPQSRFSTVESSDCESI